MWPSLLWVCSMFSTVWLLTLAQCSSGKLLSDIVPSLSVMAHNSESIG